MQKHTGHHCKTHSATREQTYCCNTHTISHTLQCTSCNPNRHFQKNKSNHMYNTDVQRKRPNILVNHLLSDAPNEKKKKNTRYGCTQSKWQNSLVNHFLSDDANKQGKTTNNTGAQSKRQTRFKCKFHCGSAVRFSRGHYLHLTLM